MQKKSRLPIDEPFLAVTRQFGRSYRPAGQTAGTKGLDVGRDYWPTWAHSLGASAGLGPVVEVLSHETAGMFSM